MKRLIYISYKNIKRTLLFFGLCSIFACSKGDDGGPAPEPEVKDPTAVTLVFPEANSECTVGTNITASESHVEFKWSQGSHTDSYSLQLKDLNSGTTTSYLSTGTSLSVKLKRGTPYSWYIVSKSNKTSTTATSSTWKFFNAGEGVSSYTPFPAEVVSPIEGASVANGSVVLEWTGTDVDNDIESYDIYFGEVTPPTEYKTGITESTVDNVPVEAGETYYWSVKTKDSQGNISNSDIFSFKGI